MFHEVGEQEKAWATYLFRDGAVIGMNERLTHKYVEFLVDKSLVSLNQKPVYGVDKNPLPWVDTYQNSGNVQIAPQEAELSSYIVGGLNNDLSQEEFEL
jgi:ribonucleoside-diphosphate reductase beta chain